jgi:hypothetical protein
MNGEESSEDIFHDLLFGFAEKPCLTSPLAKIPKYGI